MKSAVAKRQSAVRPSNGDVAEIARSVVDQLWSPAVSQILDPDADLGDRRHPRVGHLPEDHLRAAVVSADQAGNSRLSLLGCDSISRWALAPVATCIGRPLTGANAQTANVRDLAFYKITASPRKNVISRSEYDNWANREFCS